MSSTVLLEKFMLKKLNLQVLERKNLSFDPQLKLIITARVLANRGAYESSRYILDNVSIKKEHFHNSSQGRLYYYGMAKAYLYNGQLEFCLHALETYKEFLVDVHDMYCYHTLASLVCCFQENNETARSHYEHLLKLKEADLDHLRILSFALSVLEQKSTDVEYDESEKIYKASLSEGHRLIIQYFQLKHLLQVQDAEKIRLHIAKVMADNVKTNTEFFLLNKLIEKTLKEYQDKVTSKFFFVETGSNKKEECDYFAVEVCDSQLDLVGGVYIRSEKVIVLTELQSRCLYYLFMAKEQGIFWMKLSELLYGVNLNTEASFENTRKLVTKLKRLGFSLFYTKGRYYFRQIFHSILLRRDYLPIDQVFYLERCFKNHFTSADIAQRLGLKKSMANKYARQWVRQKRVTQVSNGKQKIYKCRTK